MCTFRWSEMRICWESKSCTIPSRWTGDRALERAKAKITSSKVLADEVGEVRGRAQEACRYRAVKKARTMSRTSRARAKQSSW